MPERKEIDLGEVKRLHAEGLSDGAIGKELGCSGATIGSRRKGLGLAANPRGRHANGNSLLPKVQRKAAKVAVATSVSAVEDRTDLAIANIEGEPPEGITAAVRAQTNGRGELRVVLFEVKGGSETIMAAFDAVKTALAR